MTLTTAADSIIASLANDMRRTPQPPQWHGEGDVYTHTLMVCDALATRPSFASLPPQAREVLMAAAKLHDIGKTATTVEIAGRIESPHHAPVGSRMARESLWRSGMCGTPELMACREAVCSLIEYHSFPPYAIDAPDGALRLHRMASDSRLAPLFSLRSLCTLAEADILGRIAPDHDAMLDRVALCRDLAADEGCLDACYPFPSAHTMHAFLDGRDVWKDHQLYDDTWGTVYLMAGLPGTGKDTWIRQNLPDIPMISLDEIRRALKVPPTANQGPVANIAKEQAKEHLRQHRPFVWNATNLTRTMRRQLVGLFESYGAAVSIVYLETPWPTLLSRNADRPYAVPEAAIATMLSKLEPPRPYEATRVTWLAV